MTEATGSYVRGFPCAAFLSQFQVPEVVPICANTGSLLSIVDVQFWLATFRPFFHEEGLTLAASVCSSATPSFRISDAQCSVTRCRRAAY